MDFFPTYIKFVLYRNSNRRMQHKLRHSTPSLSLSLNFSPHSHTPKQELRRNLLWLRATDSLIRRKLQLQLFKNFGGKIFQHLSLLFAHSLFLYWFPYVSISIFVFLFLTLSLSPSLYLFLLLSLVYLHVQPCFYDSVRKLSMGYSSNQDNIAPRSSLAEVRICCQPTAQLGLCGKLQAASATLLGLLRKKS